MLTNGHLEDIQKGFIELGLPEYMWQGVEDYLMRGWEPGGFLTAVITNDLKGAFSRADMTNEHLIKEWVQFMYWHMPAISQGDRESMEFWMNKVAEENVDRAAV